MSKAALLKSIVRSRIRADSDASFCLQWIAFQKATGQTAAVRQGLPRLAILRWRSALEIGEPPSASR